MRLVAASLLALSALTSGSAEIVSQGSAHVRAVALTFDAGADRGYAARILHTLESNHIRASFGMTGRWAVANRSLVARMAKDHYQIINHTFDHRSFTGLSTRLNPLSEAQRVWEINRTDEVVFSITHHSTKPYFRPPYGDYDAKTLSLVRRLGYKYFVMWTVDSLGWAHLSADSILQRCLARLKPGTIYLMHVGIESQDAAALGSLIAALRARHYGFVTIAQMVGRR